MSKPNRPIFKYEIKQHNVTNIHSGAIISTYFTVSIKDISSWGNCWHALDTLGSITMFRNNHEYCFCSLLEAKRILNQYVEKERRSFEVRTQDVSSIVERGVL